MDNERIKERIVEILSNTFKVIDKCYEHNDEASKKADFEKAGSRLIFPCYSKTYRKGMRRISEQELRFVFIEQFTQYCEEKNWDAYYSVETPTEWKYKFSGEEFPHKTDDGSGQSAMIDVCIHNNSGERICLIEFKAGNPDEFCYLKDFVKLNEEQGLCFFIQLLEKQGGRTQDSILTKIKEGINDTNYVCHTIGSNHHGTEYISKDGIDNADWKPMPLD